VTILFLGRRYSYFRNFESVLRDLAARGHAVHLAVERDDGQRGIVERLAAEFPSITFGEAPLRAEDDWHWVASRLRLGFDYLRYQHALFDDAPKLRDRARERTPGAFVTLGDVIRRRARWLRGPAAAFIRSVERGVPSDPAIRAFLEAQRPDVVLITPLVDVGSSQIDYLRAAQALGIRTALCVWSWDHLSSKALVRDCPDRVFVWNGTQKDEAVRLHGVPADRVLVTGAQCFDKWFDRQPSRDRAALCAAAGLPGAAPYLLYVCSAPFRGSQPEAPFVAEWVRRVRASADARLASMPILVRPHPSRVREWEQVDLRPFGQVAVWGSSPVDPQSQADYFDSIYHSAAVVGLNTSAFIEAGIVGRPVLTVLLPEWHENQMGTLHFRYLFDTDGGLVRAAATFDEHLLQLADTLAGPSSGVRPFVRAFVRPHGLRVAATPLFVRGVEEMPALTPAPAPRRLPLGASLRLLEWVRARRHSEPHEAWLYSERELESLRRLRAHRGAMERRDAERREERRAARAQERQQRQEADAQARAAREAARQQRVEQKRLALAEHRVRKAAAGGAVKPTREAS
jgi:hypothetical protein